jgi:phage terminase large subunit
MNAATAKKILAKRKSGFALAPLLFDPSFPQQKQFVDDPAKLKALFCTRRAAKSYTAGLYLCYEALMNPGVNLLFIGLTRLSAKGIIWKDILRVIHKKHKLRAKFNLAELTMTFPNGSVIYVGGVDVSEEEMNKLLGRKYRLVCIDEGSMYTVNVRNLVYGVLKPAMTDPNSGGQRGTICMMGTSSNFTRGLFYDITTKTEQGWSLHTWTAHDNPYVAQQWQEELDEIRTQRPLYMETPQYKQWYLNQWVVETDKLVYKFNEERNLYKELPKLKADGWTYILGVDTGWEDDNAFVLTAFHENDPCLYVVKTVNKKHMYFDHDKPELSVVKTIQAFMNDPIMAPAKVIIDGSNKQGVESMRVRSAIPFEYADKTAKADYIEMLNGDLIQGKIKINSQCTTLINEQMSLVWKTDGDKIIIPKKEHPALPNHLCDAFLYAWRNGYHYQSTQVVKTTAVGSKEWYAQQAQGIWEKEREHLIRQQNQGDGWPDDSGGWSSM